MADFGLCQSIYAMWGLHEKLKMAEQEGKKHIDCSYYKNKVLRKTCSEDFEHIFERIR